MEITERVFKSTEFVAFIAFFTAATAFLFVACIVKNNCGVEIYLAWGGMILGALGNLGWVRGKNKRIAVDLIAKRLEAGEKE